MTEKESKNVPLLIVYTGDGKGKTSAALGMCVRAVGYDWNICLIQFVKGSWKYGELEGLKRLMPNVDLHVVGEGFVGINDDKKDFSEHRKAAMEGLKLAEVKIGSGEYNLIILDEINVALSLGLVTDDSVRELISKRPNSVDIVITGRGAPDWLIEMADLVTEMKEIKHPFQKGYPAKRGIDW